MGYTRLRQVDLGLGRFLGDFDASVGPSVTLLHLETSRLVFFFFFATKKSSLY